MDFKFKKSNLNFRVYTSESEPTEAGQENDIVIITSVPMPNWILSPDKPSGVPRSDGDVWIKYSTTGNTFNILKTDSMMITTISAYQYVDGAWADVTAKSYQGGEWADLTSYVFNNGVIYKGGSWNATISDGYITQTMTVPTNGTRKIYTNTEAVNVSGYTQAIFVVQSSSPVYSNTEVGIYSESSNGGNITPIACCDNPEYTPDVDTEMIVEIPSGTTNCYFGFGIYRNAAASGATTTLKVKSILLV